jgi:hypothetical protein
MNANQCDCLPARSSDAQDQCIVGPVNLSTDELVRAYLAAKRSVVSGGYAHEIAWQASATQPLTPHRFLREAAWVILCTGMSEAVVGRLFPQIVDRLGDLDPDWLAANGTMARTRALSIFGHEGKIDSILRIADQVRALGSDGLRNSMRDPESFLLGLPYIGPVTWRHLAKNLGAPVAKADRHLTRFAEVAGRPSVDDLCSEISAWLGDPVPVVDVVLWRWSVLHTRSCGRTCAGIPFWDNAKDGQTTTGGSPSSGADTESPHRGAARQTFEPIGQPRCEPLPTQPYQPLLGSQRLMKTRVPGKWAEKLRRLARFCR